MTKAEMEAKVVSRARALGIDPAIVLNMIQRESAWDPTAVSSKGAQGLMQLMPSVQKDYGVSDPFDFEQNLNAGTAHFKAMLDRYNGDTSTALAAYNAGPGNVDKYGGIPPFEETRAYVSAILNTSAGSTVDRDYPKPPAAPNYFRSMEFRNMSIWEQKAQLAQRIPQFSKLPPRMQYRAVNMIRQKLAEMSPEVAPELVDQNAVPIDTEAEDGGWWWNPLTNFGGYLNESLGEDPADSIPWQIGKGASIGVGELVDSFSSPGSIGLMAGGIALSMVPFMAVPMALVGTGFGLYMGYNALMEAPEVLREAQSGNYQKAAEHAAMALGEGVMGWGGLKHGWRGMRARGLEAKLKKAAEGGTPVEAPAEVVTPEKAVPKIKGRPPAAPPKAAKAAKERAMAAKADIEGYEYQVALDEVGAKGKISINALANKMKISYKDAKGYLDAMAKEGRVTAPEYPSRIYKVTPQFDKSTPRPTPEQQAQIRTAAADSVAKDTGKVVRGTTGRKKKPFEVVADKAPTTEGDIAATDLERILGGAQVPEAPAPQPTLPTVTEAKLTPQAKGRTKEDKAKALSFINLLDERLKAAKTVEEVKTLAKNFSEAALSRGVKFSKGELTKAHKSLIAKGKKLGDSGVLPKAAPKAAPPPKVAKGKKGPLPLKEAAPKAAPDIEGLPSMEVVLKSLKAERAKLIAAKKPVPPEMAKRISDYETEVAKATVAKKAKGQLDQEFTERSTQARKEISEAAPDELDDMLLRSVRRLSRLKDNLRKKPNSEVLKRNIQLEEENINQLKGRGAKIVDRTMEDRVNQEEFETGRVAEAADITDDELSRILGEGGAPPLEAEESFAGLLGEMAPAAAAAPEAPPPTAYAKAKAGVKLDAKYQKVLELVGEYAKSLPKDSPELPALREIYSGMRSTPQNQWAKLLNRLRQETNYYHDAEVAAGVKPAKAKPVVPKAKGKVTEKDLFEALSFEQEPASLSAPKGKSLIDVKGMAESLAEGRAEMEGVRQRRQVAAEQVDWLDRKMQQYLKEEDLSPAEKKEIKWAIDINRSFAKGEQTIQDLSPKDAVRLKEVLELFRNEKVLPVKAKPVKEVTREMELAQEWGARVADFEKGAKKRKPGTPEYNEQLHAKGVAQGILNALKSLPPDAIKKVATEGLRDASRMKSLEAGSAARHTEYSLWEDLVTGLGMNPDAIVGPAAIGTKLQNRFLVLLRANHSELAKGRGGAGKAVEINQMIRALTEAISSLDKESPSVVYGRIVGKSKQLAKSKKTTDKITVATLERLGEHFKAEGIKIDKLSQAKEAAHVMASQAKASAKEKIRSHAKGERVDVGPPLDILTDITKYGAAKIVEGMTRFAQWGAHMVTTFGEWIRNFLGDIFGNSKAILKTNDIPTPKPSVLSTRAIKGAQERLVVVEEPPIPRSLGEVATNDGHLLNWLKSLPLEDTQITDIADMANSTKGLFRHMTRQEIQRWASAIDVSDFKALDPSWKGGKFMPNSTAMTAIKEHMAARMIRLNQLGVHLKDFSPRGIKTPEIAAMQAETVQLVGEFITLGRLGLQNASEIGRALGSLRFQGRNITEMLEENPEALFKWLAKTGWDDETISLFLRKMGELDTVEARFELLKNMSKPSLREMIRSYWMINLLSSPVTFSRNFVGTSTNAVFTTASMPFSALWDHIMYSSGAQPERTVTVGAIGPYLQGGWHGMQTGAAKAFRMLKNGLGPDDITAFDYIPKEMGWGPKSRAVLNSVFRAMSATDAFFAETIMTSHRYAQAYTRGRNAGKPWTDFIYDRDIMLEAEKLGRMTSYQEPPGALANGINNIKRNFLKDSPILKHVPVLDFLFPFIKTPVNIIKQGFQATPLEFFRPEIYKGDYAGAIRAGRMFLGSALLFPLVGWALDGRISAKGPGDPRHRQWLMDQGWRPNSIKMPLPASVVRTLAGAGIETSRAADGEYWIAYNLFQPISVPLSAVASAYESWHYDKNTDVDKLALNAIARTASSVLDQSYLTGLMGMLQSLEDPERYAETFVSNIMAGLTPLGSALRTSARVADPLVRKPTDVVERWEAGIPYLYQADIGSRKLLPKIGMDGRPVKQERDPSRRAFVVPEVIPSRRTALHEELEKLDYWPGTPEGKLVLRDGRKTVPEEETWISMVKGMWRDRAFNQMVSHPGYQQIPTAYRKAILQEMATKSTSWINKLAGALPLLPARASIEEQQEWLDRYADEAERTIRPWLSDEKKLETLQRTIFSNPDRAMGTLIHLAYKAANKVSTDMGLMVDQPFMEDDSRWPTYSQ